MIRIGQVLHLARLQGEGSDLGGGRDFDRGLVVFRILERLGGRLKVRDGHLGKI